MQKLNTALLALSRLVIGLTFIFSGFVKAIDPVGSAIKFEDYFEALHLGFLAPYALGLAFLLAAFEFLMGVNVLLSLSPRHTAYYVLIMMSLMTPLTLYLAIANPVSDCGCFGDAIKMTNWETFGKNVLLFSASLFYFIHRNKVRYIYHYQIHWIPSIISFVFALLIGVYCYIHLPLIDFLPYKTGSDIVKGMSVPEGAKRDSFKTTFIYKRGDELKEFTLEKYPENDTTWHFVEQKSVLLEKGYEPPITNFSIQQAETGDDLTDIVLQDSSFTFLLISPDLPDAIDANIHNINTIFDFSRDNNYSFYCLTSSSDADIDGWRNSTGAEYIFAKTDRTTLRTMMRANPGLILLKKGVVVGKWSSFDVPDEEAMKQYIKSADKNVLKTETHRTQAIIWRAFALWAIILAMLLLFEKALLAILSYFEKLFIKKNNNIQNKSIMRKKIVAGNWKMNKTLQEGLELANELNAALAGKTINCDVVIGTPFVHLASVAAAIDTTKIGVAAQNCADKVSGAYTGEVSASMVASTGAKYVILGHSERRAYYGETTAILKEKTLLALANGLTPIFCIGEVLEEREAGKQNEVVKTQIEESLFELSAEDFGKIVLAYEPVWAIGTGKTATAAQAQEIHAYIREVVAAKYGNAVADATSILYGGSCNGSNAKELFANPDVDGGLIGGAALTVANFMPIIEAWG